MQLPTPPQNQLCSVYIYLEAFCSLCFCFCFAFFFFFGSLALTLHLLQYINGPINSNIAVIQMGINCLVFCGYAGIMLASPA